MARRSITMAAVMALVLALALPASGGITETAKMKDFYTSALQGDGNFQWVFCSQATRVAHEDFVMESYECELTPWIPPPDTPPGMGPDLGPVVYPKKAMRFTDDTGYFYFSDFIFLTCGEIVFADTWREQLTPSGQVHFKAVYSDTTGCP